MNIFFEWIFWFLKKTIFWMNTFLKMNIFLNGYSIFFLKLIFVLNEDSGFLRNEYLFWMNILDFHKMNNVLNKYFGSSSPVSKIVVPKCLKLIWNHSWIISGTYFSPFQGSITYTGASGGLRSHIFTSFGNFE